MQTPITTRLRPLGILDQLDLSFQLYRRNLLTFLGIAALVQLPALFLTTLYQIFVSLPMTDQMQRMQLDPSTTPDQIMSLALQSVGLSLAFCSLAAIINLLAGSLTSGALAYAISEAYLGRKATLGEAFSFVLSGGRLGSLMLASLLLSLAIVALSPFVIVCIGLVPLVYLVLRLLVMPQAIVMENLGPLDGWRRAWGLAEGHMLRALALVAIGVVLSFVIYLGVGLLLGVLNLVLVQMVAPGNVLMAQQITTLLQNMISGLLSVATLPIFFGAYTLFYYDLRVRKEGLDLALQAEQTAGPGSLPAAS